MRVNEERTGRLNDLFASAPFNRHGCAWWISMRDENEARQVLKEICDLDFESRKKYLEVTNNNEEGPALHQFGWGPALWAACNLDMNAFEIILRSGAHPFIKDMEGETLCRYILSGFPDERAVAIFDIWLCVARPLLSDKIKGVLCLYEVALAALKTGQWDYVLNKIPDLTKGIIARSRTDRNCLGAIARFGDVRVLQALRNEGVDLGVKIGVKAQSIWNWVEDSNSNKMCEAMGRFLVEAGADMNELDEDGSSPNDKMLKESRGVLTRKAALDYMLALQERGEIRGVTGVKSYEDSLLNVKNVVVRQII